MYIPIPHWKNGWWEGIDLRDGGTMAFPDGVNSIYFPIPPYNIHDQVKFRFDNKIMVGEIVEITLSGGRIDSERWEEIEKEIAKRYFHHSFMYLIFANGHNRIVTSENIIERIAKWVQYFTDTK